MNWETVFYISGTLFFVMVFVSLVGTLVMGILAYRRMDELKQALTERLNRPSVFSFLPVMTVIVPMLWRLVRLKKSKS
jgi:hypothetical protein